jgi:DNA-binding XRE family transcriptional regulator
MNGTRPRIDARGDVWCHACRRYLMTTMFVRSEKGGSGWRSYCVPCEREMDRVRYRLRTTEIKRHAQRRRRDEQAKRRELVSDAIKLLRRRGLSKADIARLIDAKRHSIPAWERGDRLPKPTTVKRIMDGLRATRHLAN